MAARFVTISLVTTRGGIAARFVTLVTRRSLVTKRTATRLSSSSRKETLYGVIQILSEDNKFVKFAANFVLLIVCLNRL